MCPILGILAVLYPLGVNAFIADPKGPPGTYPGFFHAVFGKNIPSHLGNPGSATALYCCEKEESIPVGCVPSTAVTVEGCASWGSMLPRGVLPEVVCFLGGLIPGGVLPGGCASRENCVLPGGVCLGGVS